MKNFLWATASLALLGPAIANEKTASSETQVENIVVSASRIEQPQARVIGDVSILTREDIEAMAPNDMADLLDHFPGVDVVRSGSFGSQTSVFLRGAESDHVLVLVDGVRVNSSTVGVAAWADFHPSQVERIELVRGARSAIYGSDAIGGVVHIFTRKNDRLSVSVRAGSFDTSEVSLGIGAVEENGYAGITVNVLDSDGFSAQNANADMPASMFGPAYVHDNDDDGIKRTSIASRLGLSTERWQLDVSLQSTTGDVELDSSFGAQVSQSDQDTITVSNTISVSDAGQLNVLMGYNRQESGNTMADRRSAEVLYSYAGNAITWLAGAGSENVHGETSSYDKSVSNQHVFLQALGAVRAADWQLAVRQDDHENFGKHTSVSGALGWWALESLRFNASYAEGFRAPTLSDLFSPGFGGFFAGNPDLEPEESENIELGVEWYASDAWTLSLTAFDMAFENLIAFQGTNSQAINVAKANVEGLEFDVAWADEAWFANLAVTLQRARDANGAPLLRRPDEKATLQFGHAWETVNLAIDIKAASESQDFGVTLAGYEVLGASLSWDATKQLKVSLRADNMLDESYQVANGFNTTPRSGYLTLRYNFD